MSSKVNYIFSWFNWNLLGIALVTKFLILLFGAQAFQILNNTPLGEANSFLGIWNKWDAAHYLKIAASGYTSVGDDRFLIVFLPLYPGLVNLFQLAFRDYLVSGFIVSGLASVVLALAFGELVKLDYSSKTAQLSVFFLFIFPTSYFLHIPYTESLFLALVIVCFLAARKGRWVLVGIFGACACATRINGLVLVPAIAFEIWAEYRHTKKWNAKWLFSALIPVGFCIYLGVNELVAGDPLKFLEYQREHWHRYFRYPWEAIIETYKRIHTPNVSEAQMIGVQEFLFVLIGLLAIVYGWRQLRNSYKVWMILNWLMFVSTSFVLSVPRYTLSLFPLFIVMARMARQNWWMNVFLIVWSILFLALFAANFVRGAWAF